MFTFSGHLVKVVLQDAFWLKCFLDRNPREIFAHEELGLVCSQENCTEPPPLHGNFDWQVVGFLWYTIIIVLNFKSSLFNSNIYSNNTIYLLNKSEFVSHYFLILFIHITFSRNIFHNTIMEFI